GLEVGSIRRIQRIGYGILGVSWSRDHVLTSSGYSILSFIPLWSLVSAGMDTPYLP
ncbi:hypothetical protein Tco_0301822, partial [Tanacetum coccineum]